MDPHDPASGTPRVTVRYWAAARAAAGRETDVVPAATVADALAAVRGLHADSAAFARLLSICSLLLGDRPVRAADIDQLPVSDGDTIDVLPPFAGG